LIDEYAIGQLMGIFIADKDALSNAVENQSSNLGRMPPVCLNDDICPAQIKPRS